MAANDTSFTEVFGTNSGIYAGNAIPSGITSSADKVLIIPLSSIFDKADLYSVKYLKSPFTATDYDSPTDAISLLCASLLAFTALNSKASPINSLRKFDCSYFGLSLDTNFETGKTFVSRQFSITTYQETSLINDSYDPSINTLT
jgi:hypothetical protein